MLMIVRAFNQPISIYNYKYEYNSQATYYDY